MQKIVIEYYVIQSGNKTTGTTVPHQENKGLLLLNNKINNADVFGYGGGVLLCMNTQSLVRGEIVLLATSSPQDRRKVRFSLFLFYSG